MADSYVPARHAPWCTEPDGYCQGECQPEPPSGSVFGWDESGPAIDRYDPDDVEPMGGDIWWREREP